MMKWTIHDHVGSFEHNDNKTVMHVYDNTVLQISKGKLAKLN